MKRQTWTACWLIAAAAAGCLPSSETTSDDGTGDVTDLRKRLRELEAQVAALEGEKLVLSGRVREMSAREEALIRRQKRLELMNAEQAKQIEVLKLAPAERDEYRRQVEVLTVEVNRLAKKVVALKRYLRESGLPEEPPATTRPAAP
jgi:predicted RNase H-like nuclease (RuvC/YqgF family)